MDKESFDEKVSKISKNPELLAEQLEKNGSEAEDLLNDKNKMDEFLKKLEKKFSRIPILGKYLTDIPVLIFLVKAYINKEYTEIPVGTIIAIVSALIYFVSPFDIIPDFIPGIGYIDDAAVIALLYKMVHGDIQGYKEWRDKIK